MVKSKIKIKHKLSLVEVFLLITIITELLLIFVASQFTSSASFNGSLSHGTSFFYSLNPAIETFWTAEIIGLLICGIYAIIDHKNHSLGTVYSPNIAAFMGFYGLYFGYYYPHPEGFNILTQSALHNLLVANLWLAGGLYAGRLIGKGLECAGKPEFWIRKKPQSSSTSHK